MTAKNEIAFMMNTTPAFDAAITIPPSAGPIARAMLNPTEFSATAAGSSSRGTSSGIVADHAGWFSDDPMPNPNVSSSSDHGPIRPISVSTPIAAATASISDCVKISQRRRSIRSAIAPAGSVIRKTGSVVAVWTSATGSGDVASSVISQEAATVCIHVPTFETTEAIHMARNRPCRSGVNARFIASLIETASFQSGEPPFDAFADRFQPWRQLQCRSQRVRGLVDQKSGTVGRDFEEHTAGLSEVNRPEVLAIDDARHSHA